MGNGGDHTLLTVIVVIINNIFKNLIKNVVVHVAAGWDTLLILCIIVMGTEMHKNI
jgi:hypothetical protein